MRILRLANLLQKTEKGLSRGDDWRKLGARALIPLQSQNNCLRNQIFQFGVCSSDNMPRGEFNVHFSSRGGSHIRAEEAAGIALLVIILAALLLLGCWYFRRRSGYKMIRNPQGSSQAWREIMRSGQHSEGGAGADNKMALSELTSFQPAIPNAPPAYEKIAPGSLPPPYTP